LSRPSIGFRASTVGASRTPRDGLGPGGTSRAAGEVTIGKVGDFDFRMLKLQGLDAR